MYPSGSQSNIGTLLRLIQEDQNKNLAAVPPAADPSAPGRQVVQSPLTSPEDPGSSRVVSVRPEAATPVGPTSVGGVIPTSPSVAGRVVGPIAPPVRVAAPSAGPLGPSAPGPSAPSAPSFQSSPSSPSIGTRITSSPAVTSTPAVLGANAPRQFTSLLDYTRNVLNPARSRVGSPIVKKAGPTPTPRPGQPWQG